jgi:hypothetical protein
LLAEFNLLVSRSSLLEHRIVWCECVGG